MSSRPFKFIVVIGFHHRVVAFRGNSCSWFVVRCLAPLLLVRWFRGFTWSFLRSLQVFFGRMYRIRQIIRIEVLRDKILSSYCYCLTLKIVENTLILCPHLLLILLMLSFQKPLNQIIYQSSILTFNLGPKQSNLFSLAIR